MKYITNASAIWHVVSVIATWIDAERYSGTINRGHLARRFGGMNSLSPRVTFSSPSNGLFCTDVDMLAQLASAVI